MVKNVIQTILIRADNQFKTSLYKRASKLLESWYNSKFLNAIRRSMNPAVVRCKYELGIKDKNPLKLHLGCGGNHLEGYANIDWRKTSATDLVCDVRKLPYPNDSAQVIETYHLIEHLPRHDLPKALKEWYRVLFPAGKLIIECPDFDESVKEYKEYIDVNEKRLDSIFGLQRFPRDTHRFGYNFKRLEKILEVAGFQYIQQKETQDYHSKGEPCLRVECIKGDKL